MKKAGAWPAFCLTSGCFFANSVASYRTGPVDAVINAGLEDMVVGGEAAGRNQRSGRAEIGVAEIIILIFGLGRPVRREHVFDADADGVTVAVVACRGERDRRAVERYPLVVVGIGVTALHIEQARTPGVADTAGNRAEPALVIGVGEAAREDSADIAGQPAILAFEACDPVRIELPVRAGLQAAEHPAIAIIAGGKAAEIIVARERAADMAADIEAGPFVE